MKKFWRNILLMIPLITTFSLVAAAPQEKKHDRWDKGDFSNWRNRPHEAFSDPAKSFELVKQVLLKKYVDSGLKEEDLYRAAVQGMLANIDPEMSAWNRLMTPTEYSELKTDMQGKVVGVGVEISFNETTGTADILGIVPGTPAAKAGLMRGDQILKIDGKNFKGLQLRDMVYAMRGKAGSDLKLSILHEDQVRTVSLKREALAWNTVESTNVGEGIALVSIRYFTAITPDLLKKSLSNLKSKKLKGLIIDLRGNEGGIFESAIDSIRQLVPKDKLIVKVIKRGGDEEKIISNTEPMIQNVPLVVLINGATKSGAEVMAGSLKMSANATTVGKNTFGKWSAQKVDELPNKFAIKYTTSTFLAPDGSNLSGKGLTPDIVVDLDEEKAQKLQNQADLDLRLQEDIQLQSAINIFKLKD
ncbi:MAG: S41 family peptidase [Proteobacteria bacterium]|nr:S41 family peptidase [Pseudomonadota bacterium]